MFGVHEWLSVLTCVGQAGLVALALARAQKSELALRIAALSGVTFGWNFAFLAYRVSGDAIWHSLDLGISPWMTPVALHFVLAFVGERRRFRAPLYAAYGGFGALGVTSAAGLFAPALARFADSAVWSAVHGGLELPTVTFAIVRIVAYIRRAGPEERRRARLVLIALGVTTLASATEFGPDFGLTLPQLGNLGTLVSATLLAHAALRMRLFEDAFSAGSVITLLGLGLGAVLGYLAVFETLATRTAALVIGTSAVTAIVVFVARGLAALHGRSRDERERLLFLGRLSAQMAHDLKNPLAALRAMIEYLEEERARGRTIDGEVPRLALMRAQIDRLTAMIDKYRRLGRVEPLLAEVALNDVVRGVVETASFDAPVAIALELDEALPPCRADADLVGSVVENLVRNALEATVAADGKEPAPVVVRTRRHGERLCLEVIDRGGGMSARVRERVFDDFFTTKATGTGLGLGFVRRVVDAHGGDIAVESREGEGTTMRVSLPLAAS